MQTFRSDCPLARTLDILGDKWTLLILREVAAFGKTTFKDLSHIKEGIASNILADRLEKLVANELLIKSRSSKNKLVFHYTPTPKAMELMPGVLAIARWGERHLYSEDELPAEEFMKLLSNAS